MCVCVCAYERAVVRRKKARDRVKETGTSGIITRNAVQRLVHRGFSLRARREGKGGGDGGRQPAKKRAVVVV